jgi:hypothetical protein
MVVVVSTSETSVTCYRTTRRLVNECLTSWDPITPHRAAKSASPVITTRTKSPKTPPPAARESPRQAPAASRPFNPTVPLPVFPLQIPAFSFLHGAPSAAAAFPSSASGLHNRAEDISTLRPLLTPEGHFPAGFSAFREYSCFVSVVVRVTCCEATPPVQVAETKLCVSPTSLPTLIRFWSKMLGEWSARPLPLPFTIAYSKCIFKQSFDTVRFTRSS